VKKAIFTIMSFLLLVLTIEGWCGIVEKFATRVGGKIENECDLGFLKEYTIKKGYKKYIVYSDQDGKHLIIGSLYNEKFQNITKNRLREINKVDISKLPLEDAIKVKNGNGKKKLIMITDVDCPFCREAYNWLKKMDNKDLQVYVFLFPMKIHPEAMKKSIHILCSKNPVKELEKVKNDTVNEFYECKKGKAIIKKHMLLAEMVGVSGTPMFILGNGYKVEGFNKNELERYLNN